ncbi:DUF4113 domain-containing protein [Pseudomonas putida]|uniref:DUF4113 domain-containing protein n=1 Tax=Pseudomonas putida TaxID=303 RepID=UPI0032E9C81A
MSFSTCCSLEISERESALFITQPCTSTSELIEVRDTMNLRWARGSVRSASVTKAAGWSMKMGYRSPNYLTNWNELRLIGCRS